MEKYMNIQKLECPNCHAGLDSDYGNEGIFFCKYCGQKIIVEEIQNAEYDLRIRKMEMEHEENSKAMDLKMQNMKNTHEKELKKMENKDSLIAFIVIMGGLLVMLIVVEAICFIGMMLG